jgi:hypothetical protein
MRSQTISGRTLPIFWACLALSVLFSALGREWWIVILPIAAALILLKGWPRIGLILQANWGIGLFCATRKAEMIRIKPTRKSLGAGTHFAPSE